MFYCDVDMVNVVIVCDIYCSIRAAVSVCQEHLARCIDSLVYYPYGEYTVYARCGLHRLCVSCRKFRLIKGFRIDILLS